MKKLILALSLSFIVAGCNEDDPTSLGPTGKPDTTFDSGTGFEGEVTSLALQSDGKMIAAGWFRSYNGQALSSLVRLHGDGTLDDSFIQAGTGLDPDRAYFRPALAIEPNGKIVVGGIFEDFHGISIHGIMRLNNDGTLDPSFDPGAGFDREVQKVLVQPDGKILVVGFFHSYNGITRHRIVRINNDGTPDLTFDAGNWLCAISALALQADGKIVISGTQDIPSSGIENSLARLNIDGTIDNSFSRPEIGACTVTAITIQPDGKIIAIGNYKSNDGTDKYNIARFNDDGSPDPSFFIGAGFGQSNYTYPFVMELQKDGKILIGGSFNFFNNLVQNSLVRLNSDGTLDSTFDPGKGVGWEFGETYTNETARVSCLVLQPDGKVVAGGLFSSYDGTQHHSIVRLN
jgi:uncharacterized delta-60 repeat protein